MAIFDFFRRQGLRAIRNRQEALAFFQAHGIDPTALSPRELQRAYRDLARQHHPDMPQNHDRDAATRKIMDLNASYEYYTTRRNEPEPRVYEAYEDRTEREWQHHSGPPFMGCINSARDMGAAMREYAMYTRNARVNPNTGMVFILGTNYMPRNTRLIGAAQFMFVFVPPDIAPALATCAGISGSCGTQDELELACNWCEEEGLHNVARDLRAMHRPRFGNRPTPRGYLD